MERSPERILVHPEYDDETLEFDIALVKIKAVTFSSHIQPVALPSIRQLNSGRKRRKLGKISRKETRKRLESEQRLVNESKRKKLKKLSESRIYQTQKRMNKRLKYLKQKRNAIKQNLNRISLQSGVKTSGKQRRRRTKKKKKRTSSLNRAMEEVEKAMEKLEDKIKKFREEQKKANQEKEQKNNKRIRWYSNLASRSS